MAESRRGAVGDATAHPSERLPVLRGRRVRERPTIPLGLPLGLKEGHGDPHHADPVGQGVVDLLHHGGAAALDAL